MKEVYLLIGTNLGDRIKNIRRAVERIEQKAGRVFIKSGLYESPAWGYHSENDFINQAVGIRSELSAIGLLEIFQEIEQEAGRIKTRAGYEDRLCDIDILFFGNETIKTDKLVIPHPEIHNRRFALVPMEEIAPTLVHPRFKTEIRELLMNCPDSSEVLPFQRPTD